MKWSIEDAYKKLNKDATLKKIIKATGKFEPVPSKDLYSSLLTSIVSQQLSVKAADTIWSRFILLFPEQIPHPNLLLKLHDDKIRAAGLSYQKAGYIKTARNWMRTATAPGTRAKDPPAVDVSSARGAMPLAADSSCCS